MKFNIINIFLQPNSPIRACKASFLILLAHTQTHTHTHTHSPGRSPLNERSARRRGRYLHYTTHDEHKGRTSMPSAGFYPAMPAIKRLETYAFDCTATGIG